MANSQPSENSAHPSKGLTNPEKVFLVTLAVSVASGLVVMALLFGTG